MKINQRIRIKAVERKLRRLRKELKGTHPVDAWQTHNLIWQWAGVLSELKSKPQPTKVNDNMLLLLLYISIAYFLSAAIILSLL